MQNLARIIHRADAAADGQRNKYFARRARDHIDHGVAIVARRGDIQKHQFIRALLVIARGELHRIARVAQVDEVHAFDHAAAGDIQTGNDSFREHVQFSTKLRTIRKPEGARFFRMKLHAADIVVFQHRRVGHRCNRRSRRSPGPPGT